MGLGAAIAGGLQTLGGVAQAAFSGRKRKEKDFENYANSFTPNQSITDYYNKALAKYNANPYESQAYQQQSNLINRNLTTGIDATQDRRGGLSTISGLVQGADDAASKAGAMAEQQQNASLNTLGTAARANTAEQEKKFNMLYNIKALRAGQAASIQNQGYKNIFQGLNNMGQGIDDSISDGVKKVKDVVKLGTGVN